MTPTKKTPQYTKDAINRYNAKFDRVAVNLPKGTKELIKELTGESCNAYINNLVLADLERIQKQQSGTQCNFDNMENPPF